MTQAQQIARDIAEGYDLGFETAFKIVRQVLDTIRDPSIPMIDEAYASFDANNGSLRDVFSDMIDVVLGDA